MTSASTMDRFMKEGLTSNTGREGLTSNTGRAGLGSAPRSPTPKSFSDDESKDDNLHDILMSKPKNGFWTAGKLNGKSKDSDEAVSARLFVGNLPPEGVSIKKFTEFFAKFGTVIDGSLHNRFGFIQFDDYDVAKNAAEKSNGALFEGQRIDVNVASERRKDRPKRAMPFTTARDSPRDSGPPPAKRKTVSDCLVVICSRDIRSYSDAVIYRLKDIGMVCDSFFWSENMPLPPLISDITKDGVLYAVVLTETCSADKTVNLHILQGRNPKDFRDVPLNDAFELLERDFRKAQNARSQSNHGR